MAHKQQLEFVKTVTLHLANNFSNKSVLELGSYNVNGSIKDFFYGSDYIGVDLTDGPGVDVVADAHLVDYSENSFDITISCECFEHNPKWLESFKNMYRMTKSGGVLIFSCATTGRIEHGTTRTEPKHSPGTQAIGWNYYKNLTQKMFISQLNMDYLFQAHFFQYNKYSSDLYFVGIKAGGAPIFSFNSLSLQAQCTQAAKLLHKSESSLAMRLLSSLINFPIYLASFLPEPLFQSIAVRYSLTRCKIMNLFRGGTNG